MPVLRVVDILRDGGGLGILRPLRVEPGRRVVTRSQPVCPGFAGVPDPQPQRTSPLVTRWYAIGTGTRIKWFPTLSIGALLSSNRDRYTLILGDLLAANRDRYSSKMVPDLAPW